MKRLFTITLALIVIEQFSFGQDIADLVATRDPNEIRTFQKAIDKGFTDDWNFKSIEKQEIDHYRPGVIITWEKLLNNERIVRRYSYTLNLQFYYAHEQRFVNDSLNAQGHINLRDNHMSHIDLAYTDRKSLQFDSIEEEWDFKVSHYEYEIFANDQLSCVYRSKWINHYADLATDKNKGKIQLVVGKDCLRLLK
jgi:hypothetical protein